MSRINKTSILLISALSALLISSAAFAFTATPSTLPENIVIQDIHDNIIDLPNKTGKWMIVNYWTEWCGPCKKEIPALNAFYRKNQDKIILVGVNSDLLDQKTLKKMTKNLDIQFPILENDPIKMVGSLLGTPSTYFVSPEGKIHGPLLGPQNERTLLRAINKYS